MIDNGKHKVGYARVSTHEQKLDLQISALLDYGVKRNAIFTDVMTGATQKRQGLEEALSWCDGDNVELVIWKFDRLGRSVTGVLKTLKELNDRGVDVVSITERFDSSTPMGKAMMMILLVFAEMERDMISERTKAGLARARASGSWKPRPQAMTPERIEVATRMIEEGLHSHDDIRSALEEIDKDTNLGRSSYYNWLRKYNKEQELKQYNKE